MSVAAFALTTDGQAVTVPVLPAADLAAAFADGHKSSGKASGMDHVLEQLLVQLAAEVPETYRTLLAHLRDVLQRLYADNAALRAENAVLQDEMQSLDHDLTAAREGRIGGVA